IEPDPVRRVARHCRADDPATDSVGGQLDPGAAVIDVAASDDRAVGERATGVRPKRGAVVAVTSSRAADQVYPRPVHVVLTTQVATLRIVVRPAVQGRDVAADEREPVAVVLGAGAGGVAVVVRPAWLQRNISSVLYVE